MILVTGATGTVGRDVVGALLEGGHEVVAVTRDPSTARLPDGARVVQGNPSDAPSLAAALDGVEALFLNPATTSGLYAPAGEEAAALLALAAEKGVQRVVLLSGSAVDYGAGDPLADYFVSYEDAVKASGLAWTFLRPGEFASNTLAWVPQVRGGDVVRDAFGDAATAPIHERDIAAAAALALVDAQHAGAVHVLDGVTSLTKREKLAIIGDALGRELTFQEVPAEMARAAMVAHGLSEPVADAVLGYQAAAVAQPGPASDGVAQLLGRPALTFADWAGDNVRAFGG